MILNVPKKVHPIRRERFQLGQVGAYKVMQSLASALGVRDTRLDNEHGVAARHCDKEVIVKPVGEALPQRGHQQGRGGEFSIRPQFIAAETLRGDPKCGKYPAQVLCGNSLQVLQSDRLGQILGKDHVPSLHLIHMIENTQVSGVPTVRAIQQFAGAHGNRLGIADRMQQREDLRSCSFEECLA
ncbi:hypothetical protein [Mycetocola saprophilus]|uniref:hypothetical protein n=1 Tax=Mycetocola saprophilus TaxID=76636 RepID=UPI003BF1DF5C